MPDQNPKFEKMPRPETIEAFVKYVLNTKIVTEIKRIKPQLMLINRTNGPSLKVHITNIYIVGEADVAEIVSEESDLNAIVTLSGWNSYTSEAKSLCKEYGIGLFVFKEFLGAVYKNGKYFLDYLHPEDKKRDF